MLKRRTFLGFVAAIVTGKALTGERKNIANAKSSIPMPRSSLHQESPTTIKAFEISELLDEQEELEQAYLPFLDEPSMSMGIYSLEEGARDGQSPHRRDEVYVVLSGEAIIEVDGEDHPVQEGSIVFVGAEVRHRFHTITEDLKVLVFFSTGPTMSEDED